MKQILLVFFGGGLGSVARYGLNRLYTLYPVKYALATLTANFLSCLIFGFVLGMLMDKEGYDNQKLFLLTGFCGGFSTFSSFAFESNEFMVSGQPGMAVANIILNFTLSITALYLGGWLTKIVF